MADREDCRVVRKVEEKRPTSNSHPSENGGNVTGPILKPANLSDKDAGEVLDRTPLARWGGARAITEAVLYLLDADFVTGQVLYVDGGRSIA